MKILSLPISFAMLISLLFLPGIPASAAASCPPSDGAYSAGSTAAAGNYNVYARLGQASQTAVADITVSSNNGSCLLAESTAISGAQWTHVGMITSSGGTLTSSLAAAVIAGSPTANRPSLLLLPATSPACTISGNECHTQVAGLAATIVPADSAEEHSGLHVYVPQSGDTLAISEVRYYADNALMYTSTTLQPFDERMIPGYAREVSRVIVYTTGQQAIVTEAPGAIPKETTGTLFYRLWRQHRGVVTVILIAAGVLLLQQLVKLGLRAIRHRYDWRRAHGFLVDHTPATVTARHIEQAKYIATTIFVVIERVLIYGTFGIAAVFAITTFALTTTQVNGESMAPQLSNRQFALINLLPVTVAHLNNAEVKLNRSDVVAVRPSLTAHDTSELIVKRVIGLPGERVTVKGDVITVYNAATPSGFSPDAGRSYHPIGRSDQSLDIDITLGVDELFVVGDNRPVSIDSRDTGPVKISDVVGLVFGTPLTLQ